MPLGRPPTPGQRKRSISPPHSRNDSNSETTRSAKEILLQLDSNFSRAVGILNKYLSNEESTTYNPDDHNQNKAVGSESDLLSSLQINTHTGSHVGKNYLESEQRGGSTMSDLHNTEYVDELKEPTGKLSPNVRTISSRGSDLVSSPGEKPGKPRRVPKSLSASDTSVSSPKPAARPTVTKRVSSEVRGAARSPRAAVGKPAPTRPPSSASQLTSSPVTSRRPTTPQQRGATPQQRGETPQPRGATPQKRGAAYSTSSRSPDRSRLTYRPGTEKYSRGKYSDADRQYSDKLSQDSDDEDMFGGTTGRGGDESRSETTYTLRMTEPDPSAARDLDNASPKTLALCRKFPCHYCVFVYFPSSTVDEDLMPFRRKAFMDKVARIQNPEHIREVRETKCARDAFADRRIKSIERQSGTRIRLSDLDPNCAFVKGLPRRRLTIAGPTFAHIGCALNLFESLLPKVIKNANFPYRLPQGASTRFSSGNRISSLHQWGYGRADGAVFLRAQLDDKGGWRSFLVPKKG